MTNVLLFFTLLLLSTSGFAQRGPRLQCFGLPELDFELFSQIRQAVVETDPDEIVVTAEPRDPCSVSYLQRIFSSTTGRGDLLAPVNKRTAGQGYEYICPNGQLVYSDNSCRQANFNVGILNGHNTQLVETPDGTGIVLAVSDEDSCIDGQGNIRPICREQNFSLRESARRQVVVPFDKIEDAQTKIVNLPCPPDRCRGIVFRGRAPSYIDSLLTITTNEDGSQRMRLVINPGQGSGIIFEEGAEPRYRSCRRSRSRR